MAISYLGVSFNSRSKGHKAVAGAAYRAGEKLYDERYGEEHDFENRHDVKYSDIILPEGADASFSDREFLWNRVEEFEKRKDSQVAIDYVLALPRELPLDQQIELARDFARYHFVDKGLVVDLAIHDKDDGNPHAHLYTTTRRLIGHEFDRLKARDLMPTIRNGLLIPAEEHLWNEKYRSFQEGFFKAKGISLEIDPNHLITLRHEGRVDPKKETHYLKEENQLRREASRDIALNDPESLLNLLGHEHAVFNERTIAKTLNRYCDSTLEFQHAMAKVLAHKDCVALGIGADGREAYTTRANYLREAMMADRASTLLLRQSHSIPAQQASLVKERFSLSSEQENALAHLAESGDIAVLVGRAGTGKSYLMKAAKEVWEKEGYSVSGVTVSGIAAKSLSDETGIPTGTLYRFKQNYLYSKQREDGLSSKDVLVVDEAGMVSAPDMAVLVEIAQTSGAKLVLVGDPDQLQPVGPGAPLRALAARVGFVAMEEIRRQKDVGDREASLALSQGKIDQALDHYAGRGALQFIHDVDDRTTSYQALVNDWAISREAHSPESQLILAHRNLDVQALNQFARAKLIEACVLSGKGHSVHIERNEKPSTLLLLPGDRLLFLRNNTTLDVKNGQLATVVSVMGESITVRRDGQTEPFTFSTNDYKDFDYGYAATVHKTQGVTLDRAFVYAGGAYWNRHLAYVALTRHREAVKLYASSHDHADLSSLKSALSRDEIRDNVLDFPLSYAERRGFDPESLVGRFIDRVMGAKEKVHNGWLFVTNYEAYLLQKAQHQRDYDPADRERAKRAALYIDQVRDLNKTRALLAKEIAGHALYQDARYTVVFEQQLALNKEAHSLWAERHSLTNVFSRNHYALDKLESAAQAYARHQNVERYIDAYQSNHVLQRRRESVALHNGAREHFASLSYSCAQKGLSLRDIQQQIKADAQSLARIKAHMGLSLEERKNFNRVERYLSAQADTKSLWRNVYARDDEPSSREQARITALTELQDKLAMHIVSEPLRYQKALHFYDINTDKLVTQSVRHSRREAVKSLNGQVSASQRRSIAHQLLADRANYPLMVEQKADWKSITKLAREHEKAVYLGALNQSEKEAYDKVASYQKTRVEAAKAWATYFDCEAKERTHLNPLLSRAKQATQQRDALAYDLLRDKVATRPFIEKARLPLKDIEQHSKHHYDRFIKPERQFAHSATVQSIPSVKSASEKIQEPTHEEWKQLEKQFHPAFKGLASSHEILSNNTFSERLKTSAQKTYNKYLEKIVGDDYLSNKLKEVSPGISKLVAEQGDKIPGLKIDWLAPKFEAEWKALSQSDNKKIKGLVEDYQHLKNTAQPASKERKIKSLNEKSTKLMSDKSLMEELKIKAPQLTKQMGQYHAREIERDRGIDR